jgi:hypothetical protein
MTRGFPFSTKCRQLGAFVVADVRRGVDRASGDEKHVAGLERYWGPAFDFVLKRAFKHIDDLLARMLVSREFRSRLEIDPSLDRLAASYARLWRCSSVRVTPTGRCVCASSAEPLPTFNTAAIAASL